MDTPTIELPTHLSASTISRFISNRSAWYAEKIAKTAHFQTKPYFQRGKGVEKAIEHMLLNGFPVIDPEVRLAAIDAGRVELGADTTGFNAEDMEKMAQYWDDIPGYLDSCLLNLEKWGKFVSTNRRIEIMVKTCSIPIIGYLDFEFEHAVIDTKVLGKKPSGLTQAYSLQGVIYFLATKKPVVFEAMVRTCPKGVPTYITHEEDIRHQKLPPLYWKQYLELAAQAMENVYQTAIEGDTYGLLKWMSFPDLSACYEADDRNELLQSWMANIDK